jgi:transmembrane sensor
VRFSGKERAIELLEGQGLFRVAKDPQRPFVVRSGGTRVRAVGTEFDVYLKPGGTLVTVVEGRVEIGTASAVDIVPPSPMPADQAGSMRATSLQLAAGEQAVVGSREIARLAKPNIEAATAWTHRQLMFNAAPLGEVAAEFNRYNFRRLVIADEQMRLFPISGVFSSSDPTSLVQFLMEQPEIEIVETDSDVVISRKIR